jgi:cell division transport system permease protein
MVSFTSMSEQDVQPRPSATAASSGPPAAETSAASEPQPALGPKAPLVPVDSTASRALASVVAILTFIAALCAGAVELVAASSADWRVSIAREATIQVRPNPPGDIEAIVAQATEVARDTAGIAAVRVLSKVEAERLLEPWLGAGLSLADLPVPRLIVLTLDKGARPDFAALRARLAERAPNATLDDHAVWLSRLSTVADVIVAVGLGLVGLVLVATALAVAFATRGAMASNREVVEVLHFVGALPARPEGRSPGRGRRACADCGLRRRVRMLAGRSSRRRNPGAPWGVGDQLARLRSRACNHASRRRHNGVRVAFHR